MNQNDNLCDLKIRTLRRKIATVAELSDLEKDLLVRLLDLEVEELVSRQSDAWLTSNGRGLIDPRRMRHASPSEKL